jgi:hypothetical protein
MAAATSDTKAFDGQVVRTRLVFLLERFESAIALVIRSVSNGFDSKWQDIGDLQFASSEHLASMTRYCSPTACVIAGYYHWWSTGSRICHCRVR